MIAPSNLADISWSSASLLSLTSSNGQDQSSASASGDSFQSILAQATTPESPSYSNSSGSGSLPAGFGLASNSSPAVPVSQETSVQRDWSDLGKSNQQSSEKSNGKSPARTWPPRVAKSDATAHSIPATQASDNNPGSDTSTANPALAGPASLSGNVNSSGSGKKPATTGAPGSGGLPVASMQALGGVKGLAGVAFAMHITPATSSANGTQTNMSSAQAAGSVETNSSDGSANSTLNPVTTNALSTDIGGHATATLAENASVLSGTQAAAWSPSSQSQVSSNSTLGSADSTAGSVPLTEVDAPDETESAPQTVRTVQVQLAGQADGRVDLRLVEHAGGLSVSVRASDSTLTKSLQENLPDLSARLAEQKYQSHTFVPSAGETSGGGTASSSDQPSGGQTGEPGTGEQATAQNSSGGNGNGRQSGGQSDGRPDQEAAQWRQLAALAKLSSGSANTTNS